MSPPVTSDDRGVYSQRAVDGPMRVLEDRVTEPGQVVLDDERVLQQGKSAVVKRLLQDRLNYDMWLLLKWNSGSQLGRAQEHYDRFSWVMDIYGYLPIEALEQLREDMRLTDTIITDVDDDIHRAIEAGNVLSDEEITWIIDRVEVAEQAHSLLLQTNDAIDILVRLRVLRRIRLYTSLRIGRLADRLQERLAQLQVLLAAALKDYTKAWVKGVLNASIAVTTWAMPQLGLLARGGLYLSQIVMNAVLGNRTDVTLAGAGAATDLQSKIEEFEDAHSRRRGFLKSANRVVTVTGFAFDVQEVLAGYHNVNDIENLMNQAVKASDQLVVKLEEAKHVLKMVEEALLGVEAELVTENIDVNSTRTQLDSMMKSINYAP